MNLKIKKDKINIKHTQFKTKRENIVIVFFLLKNNFYCFESYDFTKMIIKNKILLVSKLKGNWKQEKTLTSFALKL